MASSQVVDHNLRRKGKQRATEVTETTPLLSSASSLPRVIHEQPITRHRIHRLLCAVFISSLCCCVLILLFILILGYSYRAKVASILPEDVINHALVFQGPNRINVLNVTKGEMWLQIDALVGIDAGALIDVHSEDDDGLLSDLRKVWGRWGIRKLRYVTVDVGTVRVTAHNHTLAFVDAPLVTLPVRADPPADLSWLTAVSLPVLLRMTDNMTDIMEFARETWQNGLLEVRAHVANVHVQGGVLGEQSWRRRLSVVRIDVDTTIRVPVPEIPGLPKPGGRTPFPGVSDLVKLHSFHVSSANETVLITASAALLNPLPPSLSISVPSLPFTISLPSLLTPIPVASAHSASFTYTHPNATLHLTGHVLPLPPSSPALSLFLSTYLSALPPGPDILISSPLFPGLNLDTVFPAPAHRPRLLRNVALRDMTIKPGSPVRASGTVHARVVLPRGIRVGLHAQAIWPDALVFDGAVPDDDDPDADGALGAGPGCSERVAGETPRVRRAGFREPPPLPLPDPLPARAFARIRPDDWIPALSTPIPPYARRRQDPLCQDVAEDEDDDGAQYDVTATVTDIPLEVLPGRDAEFRRFVTKVVFGTQGALAGVQGVAAVAASVDGLPIQHGGDDGGGGAKPGVMELTGLPFQGSFRIGKKTL